MRQAGPIAVVALMLWAEPVLAQSFSYLPPGDLVPGSGEGREDYTVYAPGIRFPVEVAPAFVNSQVWGHGGSQGPGGSQCDEVNYSYPWRDNYCESRQWEMPLCPTGIGHQGEDMRPSTCDNHTHWAVATVDGTITNVGSYSVYLTAADGTRYDYLHMSNVQVAVGQEVLRGDRLGYVSNVFGGTPTTIHLHFNLRQFVDGLGEVYVPPYLSLVEAYQALINLPPQGELSSSDCEAIGGWALDPDGPDEAVDVLLSFDGPADDPAALQVALVADLARATPCEPAESCSHGFELPTPYGLLDGEIHAVYGYAYDTELELGVELAGSPAEIQCTLGALDGYRRELVGDAMEAWKLSEPLDRVEVSAATLAALPETLPLGDDPELVTDDSRSALWVIDGALKRPVADEAVARAWRLDGDGAASWLAADLAQVPTGPPLRSRPLLLTAAGGPSYLLDDDLATAPDEPAGEPGTADGVVGTNEGCACASAAGGGASGAWWLGPLISGCWALRGRRRRAGGGGPRGAALR